MSTCSRTVVTLIQFIFSYICPPCCLSCNKKIRPSLKLFFCEKCEKEFVKSEILNLELKFCQKCFEPLLSDYNEDKEIGIEVCPLCRAVPSVADRTISFYNYHGDQNRLLLFKFKFYRKYALCNFFATIIEQNIKKYFPFLSWDLIIPIPSSPDILKKRGYNHIALLAKNIAKRINIFTTNDILISAKKRCAQAELAPEKRYKNMKNAFAIAENKISDIVGKDILLIDDTITTGATIESAAKVLLECGVNKVDVLTIFRSEHFMRYRVRQLNKVSS